MYPTFDSLAFGLMVVVRGIEVAFDGPLIGVEGDLEVLLYNLLGS